MKTRLLTFVAVLALVLASAPTALGYDTTNYAGRPNASTFDGSCHWTIYGRVDNRMVLFGPKHCWQTAGAVVKGATGQRLGVIASVPSIASAADMTWVWLDSGQYPATKNVIAVNGTDWTITAKYPSSTLSCTNWMAGASGPLADDTLKVSYWTETNGYEGPFSGTTYGQAGSINYGSGHCLIATSVLFTAGSRHVPSGAPWLDATLGGSGFIGDTTDCTTTGCSGSARMRFNSWRQAIVDLNNYWEVRGTTYGAWFCSNSSCT